MKNNKLTRRQFIGLSAAFGSFSLVPGLFWNRVKGNFYKTLPDISVIESTNYYDGTIEAINALGGIQKFVSKGSKVGLLINGKFSNEGTFTNPDISLAVLKLCYEAGANTFVMFGFNNEDYWSRSKHYESHLDILKKISYSSGYKNIAVDKGKTLREAEMSEELPDLDVLINLPISKHHNAANLTCCLKNMMGLCAHTTNAFFHTETGQRGPTDSNRLAQCIADINTVRKPDLFVVDATSFILNNGPHGPGEVHTENKIIAGTDPVALDAYCSQLLELEPEQVLSVKYAGELGVGQSDLSKVTIRDKQLG